jgi:cytochrome c peroxidase
VNASKLNAAATLKRAGAWAIACLLPLVLAGCGGGGTAGASSPTATSTATALSATAALGQQIFNDPSLSASGRLACVSCHDPAHANGGPNGLAAQLGGPSLMSQGHRSAMSIRYLASNTAFFLAADGTPTGGFFWDGRANSLQDQAGRPFLTAHEMANASAADVADKLSRAPYAPAFRAVYGSDIFSRPDEAFQRAALAVQQFELEDPSFRPYSSKYDEFLRGKAALSDQELRGLMLFNSPAKGNCAACHPSAKGADGSLPLFTDFTYDNLGVPRNAELAQNNDPAFFDLGLCGPDRTDLLVSRPDLCGAFKVPSLRNVALRGSFFHNGRFKTLKDTLTFYVQRDTNPEKFYPVVGGTVAKFDDLPPAYVGNVNTSEAPYNRQPGDAPALSDAEVDDVIAFLRTLTDGYAP